MKGAVGLYLCVVFLGMCVVLGGAQSPAPCTNDDYYIYNNGRVAFRIDSTNDHVHVCNDTDLCEFISEGGGGGGQRENITQVFTEVDDSAFKTIPGSLYVAGTPDTADDTYDGLTTLTAPQTLLWYGSKAAFRAGEAPIGGTRDSNGAANIGLQSAAFGFDTLANGQNSFAAGESTTSSAFFATSFGRNSIAAGNGSTAQGTDVQNGQSVNNPATQIKPDVGINPAGVGNPDNSIPSQIGPDASGIAAHSWGLSSRSNNTAATAFGYAGLASGPATTVWGVQCEAFGEAATSWGLRSYAEGIYSTAFGFQTVAESRRSTTWGFETAATWPDSTATGSSSAARAGQSFVMGQGNQVSSHSSLVIGSCNSDFSSAAPDRTNQVGGTFPTSYPGRAQLSTDYVFQIGNGPSESEELNPVCYYQGSALTVLKNGDLYVAGNIYYGIGNDPYDVPTGQNCRCLSADQPSSCNINSLTNQCTLNNKRSIDEADEITELRSQIAELQSQIEQLSKLIQA